MKRRLTMLVALPVLWAGGAHGEPTRDTALADDSCVPAALLSGEPALVESLGYELTILGVSSRATPNCPSVTVSVEKGSAGVVVSLREPEGRRTTRSLGTLRIAATWIDSWLHEDLGAPLLATRRLPSASAPATAASAIAAPQPPEVSALMLTAPPLRRYQASLGYDTGWQDQDASWRGLRATVCATFGPACLGVNVSAAQNRSEEFLPDEFSTFSQRAADVLVQVQVPLDVGQATLSPSLSLGAGWFSTTRKDIGECITDDGALAPCQDIGTAGASTTRSSWSPKAEAGLGVSLPVVNAVRIELGGALGIRPISASRETLTDGLEMPPEPDICTLPSDPSCSDAPVPGSFLVMPGEPTRSWRLSIGLQVQL